MEESRNFSYPPDLPQAMLPPTRSERRDAAEHRRRILEAAQHLFAQQGVDAVSMHQIAIAAGVGQGTLYRRYAHKGDLCMDLLREGHERLLEEIAKLFEATTTASALERLEGVLTCMIAFLEEQGALLGPVVTAERDWLCNISQEHIASQGAHFYLWLHELFAGLLNDAVHHEELAPLDVPYTVDAILSTLHPFVYRIQRYERGYSPERILQGMRHIYIEGVQRTHVPAARTDNL